MNAFSNPKNKGQSSRDENIPALSSSAKKGSFFKIPNDLTVRPHRTARGAIWVSNRGEGEDNGWVITSVRD